MKSRHQQKKRTVLATACWFTAVLNGLFSTGHAQEIMNEGEPSDGFSVENVLRYGPFDVLPTLRGGVVYDDNINTAPRSEDEIDDVIWAIAPGVTLGVGDYKAREFHMALLSYSPNFLFYTKNSDENDVDHDARFDGQLRGGFWTFGVRQSFQQLSGNVMNVDNQVDLDAGSQVDRTIYTTEVLARYELSPKTTLDFTGTQSINDYDDLAHYNEWTLGAGADYAWTPKIKVGAVANFGWIDQEDQLNQSYQQLLGRMGYSMTEKVDFHAAAGVQFRQLQEGDSHADGIYNLGGTYRPWLHTTFTGDAYRREQNSVSLANVNYVTTGFTAGVQHVFREFYMVSLRTGYDHLDYTDRITDEDTREDNYFHVRVGFDWQVTERLSLGTFYQFRDNDSEHETLGDSFSFANHQVGASFAYRF